MSTNTPLDLASPFRIGSVDIRNRVILAPMSGVTDLPFRVIAHRFGAGMVVTEMVASRELVHNTAESWARLEHAGLTPHVVQLAGRDPHFMAEGARVAEAHGAAIIDINMGCPAKKVIGGLSGSALMREPELALSIIAATVKAVTIPVTVKMRLGWDEASLNAPEIAARAEQAGVAAITVHGRTRMQFYEGKANWVAIRKVRDAISLPLIANGDVETPEDCRQILDQSGADALMVGRAAVGQPWLPAVLAGIADRPSQTEIADLFEEHYRMMLDFYGENVAVRHARKHVARYLELHAPNIAPEIKAEVMMAKDPGVVIERVVSAIRSEQSGRREAA